MSEPDSPLAAAPLPSGVRSAPAACPSGGRQLRLSTGMLCLLLLSIQFLAPLPMYVHAATSMAAGTIAAAVLCIMTVTICWAVAARASGERLLDIGGGGIALIATVIVLITLHGAVADQVLGIDVGRFLTSLILLVVLLGAGLAVSAALRGAAAPQIVTLSWVSFWAFCGVIVLRAVGLQPGIYTKSTFPFTETSHFALAFGPIFLYRCASARPSRRTLWVLLAFALAFVLKSGALVGIAFLAAMICRRFLIIAVPALVIAVAGASVELEYFTSRADLSDNSSNLSALVYLEGWEMLGDSLEQSHGWGIGFQQLGVRESEVTAADTIARLTGGGDLNQMDGSFVLSKLGSEFGVIGLLLVAGYCALALLSLRCLRGGRGPPAMQFARCIVLAYGGDMFVRGIGYFSPSSLLFLGALLVLAPTGGLLRAGLGPKLQTLMVLR